MNNFVRTSNVCELNSIRTSIWNNVYSSFENLRSLMQHIYSNFIPNTIDIDIDFIKMSIALKSKTRPFDIDETNKQIINSYKAFISDMYSKGKLSIEEYNKCLNNIDNIFFITVKNSNEISINL